MAVIFVAENRYLKLKYSDYYLLINGLICIFFCRNSKSLNKIYCLRVCNNKLNRFIPRNWLLRFLLRLHFLPSPPIILPENLLQYKLSLWREQKKTYIEVILRNHNPLIKRIKNGIKFFELKKCIFSKKQKQTTKKT